MSILYELVGDVSTLNGVLATMPCIIDLQATDKILVDNSTNFDQILSLIDIDSAAAQDPLEVVFIENIIIRSKIEPQNSFSNYNSYLARASLLLAS